MTDDSGTILRAAQAGDEEAYAHVVEPYRRELLVHCYRMLGSLQDAEDSVQETLLRAWRRLDRFRGRLRLRAWLYKIATNICLDALDRRPRRKLPAAVYPAADPTGPIALSVAEPIWMEPLPEEWLVDEKENPEARYAMRESITLAFQLALQVLPPRQRAVLILRDVVDWSAKEVSDLLDMTVSAVNSALHRARATMTKQHAASGDNAVRSLTEDERWRRLLDDYVRAWDAGDIARLTALLKEDATLIMPPLPTWYQGREAILTFAARVHAAHMRGARSRYIPTRANGQPAMAVYHWSEPMKTYQPFGLHVLTVDESVWQITKIVNFLNPELFPRLGLAAELSK